jgi:hypothetical protein
VRPARIRVVGGTRSLGPVSKGGVVRTVGLVACTSRKREHPTAAEYMYDSPLFKGASYYCRTRCDVWYVLSAKHGVISPLERIDPYDQSLIGAKSNAQREWAQKALRKTIGLFSLQENRTGNI